MFIINWGKLTNRWDPTYVNFQEKIVVGFKFPIVKFKDLLRESPFYGANEPGSIRESNEQIRYVRITDIDDDGRLTAGLGATCNVAESKYLLQDMDLLIARSGNTVGKSYLHDVKSVSDKCIFAGYLINFRVNSNLVLPYYIYYYLQCGFFKEWKNATMRFAGQPNINAQEYKNMPIALPDINIQQRVVSIMNEAYEQKKKKQKESEDLLKSINDYILNILGIYLSNTETYGLRDRIFYIKSSDVFGQRLDPAFYFKASDFEQCLMHSEYSVVDFNDIITSVSNGVEIRNYQTSGYRYLRVSDMSSNGIVDNNIRFVEADGIPTKIRLSLNDIIISRSGSLGLVNAVTDEILDAILSSHIFKVSIMPNINVNYLQEYLRSTLGQIQFFRNNNGGIIPEINQNALKKIKIVLPSKEIQDEIAQFSVNSRNRANELIDESDKIISNAKQEVENILMGE